jgi:hypothetical protein
VLAGTWPLLLVVVRWPTSCALLGLLAGGLVASASGSAVANPVAPGMLSDGTLSITVPVTASLGSITIGAASSISASLGTVTVNGTSGLLGSGWTASVTSTGFTNGTTTIPPGSITYTAGAASANGLSVIVPGAGTLSATTALRAQTATVSVGLGAPFAASWNPTIQVALPASVTAGIYTATITHSVA